MKRKPPTLREKLASALLEIFRLRGDPIPRDIAKMMSADQICSLVQWDHDAGFVAHGAGNHPTEISPRLILEHRWKTSKVDQPAIAKCDRLSQAHDEFRARVLAIKEGRPIEKAPTIKSRGFPTKEERQAMKERYARKREEKA